MCRITVNGKPAKIRFGIEECYSKILKNEKAGKEMQKVSHKFKELERSFVTQF